MIKTQLNQATPKIIDYFNESGTRLFRVRDLRAILQKNRTSWELDTATTTNVFLNFALKNTELLKVQLEFPSRTETRYTWGKPSDYELCLSLRPGSYLTHETALALHGLIERPVTNIYVNLEQPPKRFSNTDLSQDKITLAFQNKVRVTNARAQYNGKTIWLINGMHTGKYGVIEHAQQKGAVVSCTNLERTLIDAAVRPIYSGDPSTVLEAYKRAATLVSIERLADTLRKLGYIYPYHQVIGFYLDQAGTYDPKAVDIFLQFGLKYDFYLTHKMGATAYSEKWRLYYPVDL